MKMLLGLFAYFLLIATVLFLFGFPIYWMVAVK